MNKQLKEKYNIPVFNWCPNIEDGAMEQVEHLAQLPFVFHHIAVMPDSHLGYGMPIGGVMATKDVIVSNAVGVDIGCGMNAVKTSLTEIDTGTLKKIMGEIRKAVPVGFSHQKEKQDESLMPEIGGTEIDLGNSVIGMEYKKALTQIGTLGGGNHFIEIQKGSDGHIWIMIHSGSRNLGFKVADYYNKLAVQLNQKWFSQVPKEWELAFLPIDSEEGQNYIKEMNYCVEFALANRKLMMDRIKSIFEKMPGSYKIAVSSSTMAPYGKDDTTSVPNNKPDFEPMINIAHNYARLENHFGQNVWVHRKGATSAREGEIGIIPGSQGTKSYIVKGKGNPESFMSCSHGAGRVMGRKQAQRELNLEEEIAALNKKGIIHSIRGKKDLDEAPSAYKPIKEVMDNQKDLVEILVELSPLAVVKG